MKYRIEKDSLGEIQVPKDALWGAQTQRALENFKISGIKFAFPFGRSFIEALGIIKCSAALTNKKLKLLDTKKAKFIQQAAREVLEGKYDDQFPLDIFQTGSGTSTNMNANEVIANIASKRARVKIHPNDHVNMSQSSNDVIPTAIHISAAIDISRLLLPKLNLLLKELQKKKSVVAKITKTGRTHLMDAMPLNFSQELSGWIAQLEDQKKYIELALNPVLSLPQGGTAIGTGINAPKQFGKIFAEEASRLTKLRFRTSSNYFKSLSSQDAATNLSTAVKNLSLVILKISNDLRWMNSGPMNGLSEIELEALQPGSSIMPGKVNPVVSEAVMMAAADVMGNDLTISYANQSGNFQLNVMLPVIAYNLLKSITLMANSCEFLAQKGIRTFKVNKENISLSVSKNPILVTALNREIGYEKAALIAKKAYKENRSVIEVAHEITGIQIKKLKSILNPANLTKGGLK